MDTILEQKKVDERVFAAKLRYWINHGFPELGDCMDDPHFTSPRQPSIIVVLISVMVG
jgi:hypothetical protein